MNTLNDVFLTSLLTEIKIKCPYFIDQNGNNKNNDKT